MPLSESLRTRAPDVERDIARSGLYSDDLAPVAAARRKWGLLSLYYYAWFVGFGLAFAG